MDSDFSLPLTDGAPLANGAPHLPQLADVGRFRLQLWMTGSILLVCAIALNINSKLIGRLCKTLRGVFVPKA